MKQSIQKRSINKSLSNCYDKINFLYSLGFNSVTIAKALEKPYPYIRMYLNMQQDKESAPLKSTPLYLLARRLLDNPKLSEV